MLSASLLGHSAVYHLESCVSAEPEPEPEPEPKPEPEPEPKPEPGKQPLLQYVAVRPCEVTDCCDERSRVIGRLKPGTIVTCMARVINLPVEKGCTRVCFQTPRLSMLEGPNQWVSLRSPVDGSVHLEKLPHQPATHKATTLPWEGCETAENQDQLRAMLCDLTAEEARRRVALLMMELSAMDNLKRELQMMKNATRELQRELAIAKQGGVSRSNDMPTVH